jgi:hypothetical protein
MTTQVPHLDVEHLHGPKEVTYGKDELVVVCVVKDGRPWLKSFVEHYFSLGVKHIVFLDNNSSDDTVAAASQYDNVTVLRTHLPFIEYHLLMKQYLIARFGKDRWSLCVDIDELFDYPYSDVVRLDSFLRYLNSKSYTGVMAQMLDMFPEKILSGPVVELQDEPLKEVHKFYDLTSLRRKFYDFSTFKRNWVGNLYHLGNDTLKGRSNNTLDSGQLELFWGGMRETVFGVVVTLTKYPLAFSDGKVNPMSNVHNIENARLADLTCVLYHYKFHQHLRDQAATRIQEHNYWYEWAEYKNYLEVIDRNPDLKLKLETSKEITSVNDLLEDGFLVVSEDYTSWVNAQEERNLRGSPGEPHGTTEALLTSRREKREEILRLQRLDPRRQMRTKMLKIRKLEQQLRKEGRKIHRLKQTRRRLTLKARKLEEQLENMRASRIWKLTEIVHRNKARILNGGRSSP